MTRSRFPISIKRKAASDLLSGASAKSVAAKYGASESTIRRWTQEQETGELDFKGIHPPSHGDVRMLAACIHCGSFPDTEDHNPSYVFLDKPYPEELAVVGVCQTCNNSFSNDEPYLAAFIEAARTGDGNPSAKWRPKIRRVVKHNKKLQNEILASHSTVEGQSIWHVDLSRIRNVILKLAKGHAAFELHDYPDDEPVVISVQPIHLLDARQRRGFETPPRYPGWPEVGSRALYRRMKKFPSDDDAGWVCIQKGRYRYVADGSGNAATVRMVFSEYLAAEVIWACDLTNH